MGGILFYLWNNSPQKRESAYLLVWISCSILQIEFLHDRRSNLSLSEGIRSRKETKIVGSGFYSSAFDWRQFSLYTISMVFVDSAHHYNMGICKAERMRVEQLAEGALKDEPRNGPLRGRCVDLFFSLHD